MAANAKWPPPPELDTPERAIMELMDATYWAKQHGFNNVAARLEWATAKLRVTLFPDEDGAAP